MSLRLALSFLVLTVAAQAQQLRGAEPSNSTRIAVDNGTSDMTTLLAAEANLLAAGASYCVAQHINNHAIGRCYYSRSGAYADFNENHGSKWAQILWIGGRETSRYGSMGSAQWQQLNLWCQANCHQRRLQEDLLPANASQASLLDSEVNNTGAAFDTTSLGMVGIDMTNLLAAEADLLAAGASYCFAQHINNHAIGRCYYSRSGAYNDFNRNHGSKWAQILWIGGRETSRYGSMASAQWQQLNLWCQANCHQRRLQEDLLPANASQASLLDSEVNNTGAAFDTTSLGMVGSDMTHLLAAEANLLAAGASYCVAQHINNHAIGRCYSSRSGAYTDFNQNHGSKWAQILWIGGRETSRYGSMGSAQWQQLSLWCQANCR